MNTPKTGQHLRAAFSVVFERNENQSVLWWIGPGTVEGGSRLVNWIVDPISTGKNADRREAVSRVGKTAGGGTVLLFVVREYPGWSLGFVILAWIFLAAWFSVDLPDAVSPPVARDSAPDVPKPAEKPVVLDKAPTDETVTETPNIRTVTEPLIFDHIFDEASWTAPPQPPSPPF